ncbi:MAG: VOC family protein [Burkholderiaceae bacterium]|jgi:catechol 2,3-dioxygenase-like lactoylglutathione lyase family enzyme
MSVRSVNHFTILTDDLPATLDFYAEHLALAPGPRPPFGFPGAWLYPRDPAAGKAEAVLHIVAGRDRKLLVPGVIDHMAFTAHGLTAAVDRLKDRGIEHELRRLPGDFNVWQLFFHDPNGAKVELDFDGTEPGPDGWVDPRR